MHQQRLKVFLFGEVGVNFLGSLLLSSKKERGTPIARERVTNLYSENLETFKERERGGSNDFTLMTSS
jgi:uncharacterized protein (DUF2132 family)